MVRDDGEQRVGTGIEEAKGDGKDLTNARYIASRSSSS